MDNLFLIGARCTGKTSVGRRVSERLGRPFIDMDAEIEKRCGSSIRSLVDRGDGRIWIFP
jgi:shikimate kinase